MEINRDNYEIYLIDFIDGNLSSSMEAELHLFLALNSDIKEEFDLIIGDNLKLEKVVEKGDFSFLKKDEGLVDLPARDVLLIDYIEGELSEEQNKLFSEIVSKDSILAKDLVLYEKTKLNSEDEIIFEDKEELKRGGKRFSLLPMLRYGVAASLIFVALWVGISRVDFGNQISYDANQNRKSSTESKILEEAAIPNKKEIIKDESSKINIVEAEGLKNRKIAESNNGYNLKSEVKLGSSSAVKVNVILAEIYKIKNRELEYLSIEGTWKPRVEAVWALENGSSSGLYVAEFKSPTDWLKENALKQLPIAKIAQADSILKNESPSLIALRVLNEAPGINAYARKDEDGNARGFSIVSKYFSIERLY